MCLAAAEALIDWYHLWSKRVFAAVSVGEGIRSPATCCGHCRHTTHHRVELRFLNQTEHVNHVKQNSGLFSIMCHLVGMIIYLIMSSFSDPLTDPPSKQEIPCMTINSSDSDKQASVQWHSITVCVCGLISLDQKGRVVSLSVTLWQNQKESGESYLLTATPRKTQLFILFV